LICWPETWGVEKKFRGSSISRIKMTNFFDFTIYYLVNIDEVPNDLYAGFKKNKNLKDVKYTR